LIHFNFKGLIKFLNVLVGILNFGCRKIFKWELNTKLVFRMYNTWEYDFVDKVSVLGIPQGLLLFSLGAENCAGEEYPQYSLYFFPTGEGSDLGYGVEAISTLGCSKPNLKVKSPELSAILANANFLIEGLDQSPGHVRQGLGILKALLDEHRGEIQRGTAGRLGFTDSLTPERLPGMRKIYLGEVVEDGVSSDWQTPEEMGEELSFIEYLNSGNK
jgi:hypothetical protein